MLTNLSSQPLWIVLAVFTGAATVVTASARGDAPLAINNLLGSAAINVLLLAVADTMFGRDALTSAVAKPATLMQGVLGIMLLALVVRVVSVGDVPVGGVGIGAVSVAIGALAALLMTGAFTIGLLERRNRTVLRMGYDAFASILIFAGALAVMARVSPG